MQTHPESQRLPLRSRPCRGFALVVSLSLMILLTVIAVGLLTLSGVSLRASSQGEAMQAARANARLALALAINQLQLASGPDERVTATADQRAKAADGKQSSAAAGKRHWTGVYRAWPATAKDRPEPEFLGWMVSGDLKTPASRADAEVAVPAADAVELVGSGTLGSSAGPDAKVLVPATRLNVPGSTRQGRLAWWVGDQGVKAAIATPKKAGDDTLSGWVRANQQSAPGQALAWVGAGTVRPFENLAADDPRLGRVSSWQQAEFLASGVGAAQPLFHDLAPFSTGLLTNVTTGGFRKDLSLQLERSLTALPRTPLYSVAGEPGIHLQELGLHYNSYKEIRRSGSYAFTTGGRMESRAPHLMVESSATACANDDEFHLKQPTIISYQLALSFKTIPVLVGSVTRHRLHVVSDPIITMWNPLDIPVVVPTSSFITVKYWQVPYDIVVRVNGGPQVRAPLAASLSGSTSTADRDYNFLSIQIGQAEQLVFKPGEVIKFSQSGNMIQIAAGAANKNSLVAKKGFNHGGGFAMPLRDLAGNTIDLNPGERITYEAIPNALTAGKSASSGNSVTGAVAHSRHFSTTHHEVYVGPDRGELAANSLGYGGMYIDYDFGNRRLKPGEVRASNQAGTKPSGERLYANRLPEVFRPLTSADAVPLSQSQLNAEKWPFLLLSYDAKTEFGSESGTRSLARFNPKAHHVDFYTLDRKERDMLPYEFRAEPLTSWRNRSLDLSANGGGYFGGGMTGEDGTGIVCTHSIPRDPLYSLAAFQHAFANGFQIHRPVAGYATLNAREPLLPQVSHAVGNSLAPPVLAPDKTEGSLPGGRPMADHSYLANRALWDEWFLSGVAPQASTSFSKNRSQRAVAEDFFKDPVNAPLPVVRYLPDLDGRTSSELVASWFSGASANDAAIRNLASHLRVDGMFNVNSTSVEAWKALLGTLKGRPIVVRDANGKESIAPVAADKAPVTGLQQPQDLVADSKSSSEVRDPAQWVGRRELSVTEIHELANALVAEVRKRGPFLSLADFVNRRVGGNPDLARAGAVQNALDSKEVSINKAYFGGAREVGAAASRLAFPQAETGPVSYGIPGIVKQADLLTPIAPVLSVRSDSFVIRCYGEAVERDGRVSARAWCEAVVERNRNFVDPSDKAETPLANLVRQENRNFGRRYQLIAFRWLSPSDV
jgi:hypothetical protein